MREYALERLDAHGERAAAAASHARFYANLALAAEPHLRQAEWRGWTEWLRRLDADYDNLRAAQRPFDPYRGEELAPGPDATSDEAIRAYVRAACECLWHPVGTCRMGRDPMAVVDPELQVHGLVGLRVVDASVMPTIPTGNTNAATIMIAERAAHRH